MSWQLLTAISVLFLSISVLLQRVLLHRYKVDQYAYVIVFQATVAIILCIAAAIVGFSLPNIQSLLIPAAVAMVSFGVGHILYARTLQLVEASVFSVLFATQAVWIMLIGIVLFNERLAAVQIVGVIMIFASVAMLAGKYQSLLANKGTLYGLATGAVFGVAITSWSYVGRYTDGLSWAAISFVGTAVIVALLKPSALKKIKPLLEGRILARFFLLGIVYGAGSLAMLFAYNYGTFAEVTPLRQTAIIVTVLLSLVFFASERQNVPKKLLAATLCCAGVVLVLV